jgi:hypothetical protein
VRILKVGDVHATPDELDDCECLMAFVLATALALKVDYVCLLGDSYHTHNIIRVEVLAFWRRWFATFKSHGIKVIGLVGNHDYGGEGLSIHAMMAHEEQIEVVDRPTVKEGMLFMPYYSDREKFVVDCCAAAPLTKTLVCHQTFQGGKYENGFYAEDGVNPDLIPHTYILSGHIHTPQTFGKVTYIGAPRWRTLSDANIDRAIWLYTFADGEVVGAESFDLGDVCRRIYYFEDTPETPFLGTVDPRHDYRIDVRGPSDWVTARKQFYGSGVNVRIFRTDQAVVKVRESEGIDKAFVSFMERYRPKFGTDPQLLQSMAKERLAYV